MDDHEVLQVGNCRMVEKCVGVKQKWRTIRQRGQSPFVVGVFMNIEFGRRLLAMWRLLAGV
jgi:hypothetical protein